MADIIRGNLQGIEKTVGGEEKAVIGGGGVCSGGVVQRLHGDAVDIHRLLFKAVAAYFVGEEIVDQQPSHSLIAVIQSGVGVSALLGGLDRQAVGQWQAHPPLCVVKGDGFRCHRGAFGRGDRRRIQREEQVGGGVGVGGCGGCGHRRLRCFGGRSGRYRRGGACGRGGCGDLRCRCGGRGGVGGRGVPFDPLHLFFLYRCDGVVFLFRGRLAVDVVEVGVLQIRTPQLDPFVAVTVELKAGATVVGCAVVPIAGSVGMDLIHTPKTEEKAVAGLAILVEDEVKLPAGEIHHHFDLLIAVHIHQSVAVDAGLVIGKQVGEGHLSAVVDKGLFILQHSGKVLGKGGGLVCCSRGGCSGAAILRLVGGIVASGQTEQQHTNQ